VDSDSFEEAGVHGRHGRSERLSALGLDPQLPVILFAGKLQPWKRPLDVAHAVQSLRVPVNVLFIGDGPLRGEVEAALNALPNGRVLGFVNQQEIGSWYGLSDLFVLPSEIEPWGLAVNEAMAAGAVPVVSDAAGCAPDLVTSDTGRTFVAGDVGSLTTALSELLARPSRLPLLAAGARRRAHEFGIEATAQGIEKAAAFAVARRR
jgi:glycosyltransferase involved in cell wall biosynthesis